MEMAPPSGRPPNYQGARTLSHAYGCAAKVVGCVKKSFELSQSNENISDDAVLSNLFSRAVASSQALNRTVASALSVNLFHCRHSASKVLANSNFTGQLIGFSGTMG